MAQIVEAEQTEVSAENVGKPNSQTSARSRSASKELVDVDEQPKQGEKKQDGNGEGEEEEEKEEGEEEEEEEEYEIEQILDSRRGVFKKHEMAYLVKWKGYGPESNSWVTESDAANAQDLINEFLAARAKAKEQNSKPSARGRRPNSAKTSNGAKAASPDTESVSISTTKRGRRKAASSSDDEDEEPRKQKKTRVNSNTNGSASAKRGRLASLNRTDDEDTSVVGANTGEKDKQYKTMKELKLATMKSWEDHVKEITTVEHEKNGPGLMIFFETTDGHYVREPSTICAKKFPQKLIRFYESHLRWRVAEDDENDTLL